MYSTRYIKQIILALVSSTFLFSCTSSGTNKNQPTNSPAIQTIKLYQKYISPVDGQRCSMYPSCSEYGRQAFQKYGFLTGWIITCDRLLRCGRNELTTSPPIVKNGNRYCDDPLKENVWWWSTAELNNGGK